MIINKTHNLMGDHFSKTIKRKAFFEIGFLIMILLVKFYTHFIEQFYLLTILITVIISIFFLYHFYLIIFYDLRIVFITRLMKQNFNDDTNHLKIFRKDNEADLKEFNEKLNFLTINLYIINHKNIIYTSNFIVSDSLRLLYIIHFDEGQEYIYEVLPKKLKA